MYYENPPVNCSKTQLMNLAIELNSKFLQLNSMVPPQLKISKSKCKNTFGLYYFKQKKIEIFVEKCRLATKVPGFSWSYPGYTADLTHIGVLSHEMGHYVDVILKVPVKTKLLIAKNPRITSYEPNSSEAFAETIKLFITNPDLLQKISPKRYSILIDDLKLIPVISDSWDKVLHHAHPKFKAAIINKICTKK